MFAGIGQIYVFRQSDPGKTPKNRAENLMKLDVPRWATYKIVYYGDRYARLGHNGWVHKAISNKRLAGFGLISMLDYTYSH